MENKNMLTEQLLEAAASEALGANTPMESAACQQQLASAGPEARNIDRQLRETVAAMAAASPFMAPPPDLRGKILQATAPSNFRMEDYRKATRDNSRFYKWGFYAAAVFLMAAATFNMYTKNQITRANATIASLQQQAKQGNEILTAVVNPDNQELNWRDENGNLYARAVFDVKTGKAIVITSQELLPKPTAMELVVKINGKDTPFQTTVLTGPAAQLNLKVPSNPDIAQMFNVQNILPEENRRIHVASQRLP